MGDYFWFAVIVGVVLAIFISSRLGNFNSSSDEYEVPYEETEEYLVLKGVSDILKVPLDSVSVSDLDIYDFDYCVKSEERIYGVEYDYDEDGVKTIILIGAIVFEREE